MSRRSSRTGRLVRLGFVHAERAAELLAEPWVAAVLDAEADADGDAGLVAGLGDVDDPDLALLTLVRLHAAADDEGRTALGGVLARDGEGRRRLLAVLGGSAALGDSLVAHPADVDVVIEDAGAGILAEPPEQLRATMLRAVGADPDAARPVARGGPDELRRCYRRQLSRVAASDLTRPDPLSVLPGVAATLADLASAALEAALAVARAAVGDDAQHVRLAVIGMGKTGGRELNYVSDVDVVYVAEPDGLPEDEALAVATRLAAGLARACSAPGGEPALWEVDAALRPEGKQGPLVRTLASHVAYYERWAKTWEFQALLKARPVAGDRELGAAYTEALAPMVWSAVNRENFVEDAQAMRRRVEAHVPPNEVDRQIKLGPGGLRDVEFTVQLLQLVHGRLAPEIRSRNTLAALASLAAQGFVGREDAARLAVCYRFLRLLEHRVQLYRMRRTHLIPTSDADLRRLARAVGTLPDDGDDGDPVAELLVRWRHTRRDVRRLHEELFYRPLLPATARLSAEDASLAPDAARARLAAIGYRDPDGAVRHIAALTEGVTRRAAIQRHLLPVMIGWFADGPDPDGGLLAFRALSDELGASHWYLKLLRDSGVAARRLAAVLSSSRYLADALRRSPESVAWLGEDADLRPRDAPALESEMDAILRRRSEPVGAATAIRYLRRRELVRTGVDDVLEHLAGDRRPISTVADAALRGALRFARAEAVRAAGVDDAPTRLLVVAMGRLGGHELGYASDADVMFVHDPLPGADAERAQAFALDVAHRVGALLGQIGPEPPLEVDAGLRPEGRNGPLTRSLDAYGEYYERWAGVWERQALLRARPVAGDDDLAEGFVRLVDPVRYDEAGVDTTQLRELRRIKARVEAERLPRGVPANRHLKLGRGGLADVEWTAQLLQLRHAGTHPGLRTPRTLDALDAALEADLLTAGDHERLRDAWRLASRLRDAIVLATGRTRSAKVDVLPHERQELSAVARLLGYPPGSGAALEEDYLRSARRARGVVERLFYGD
ncbi:(Glutamate--ammonia-ligase) adenylyltransferase [Beutenbergia cavernae DSM 12333]|uniref:(Glutamate--ammonia-ligase) adenylyltransferase n=1 Tax=Beutenbergia cavernae (strain ATCC BAA-8 / DSM 12333 / CCUG 43141 / JCM 11478 / NBRC 16432 / NCIMB 13614 / HKI 0122) TaxID=471853 RepID=C5C4X8_BEUC1|nr:bifunctional [glutamine synthetase] adenylyltransferase/[glutamine synthetase]-adenylyl-L-tyrosine phosphorylase [Beutenbergia cavernae]ACQ80106.1 (Glutamate--ammonia-ligase) adenylyltransferase [Beutenbergia cavernae DSM 12333]